MSNAKKCDVCGLLYERTVEPKFNVYEDNHPYPPYKYDLCDNCVHNLEMFLNGARLIY